MSASFLPLIFVPLIGIVFPFITLSSFFLYVEKENID
uniref:Photosystem I reaction center subunit VIII n=1 Tax=Euglena anabaena TaxID=38273 RepID=A0A0G3F6U5_EUGAN|nr:photosystem I 4 kDa hydrophobic subunit [Euglenaria anabaena]AKJ83326.1 photosystem I 4 kDa hydrophobic subunit [Euglenaria anabaena]